MKTFRLQVSRQVYEYGAIDIQANSKEEAEAILEDKWIANEIDIEFDRDFLGDLNVENIEEQDEVYHETSK